MTPQSRKSREKAGRRAEGLAAMWLRLRGYKILEMRYKTKDGEIDIIARRGKVLACIEVKYRREARYAQEAVTYASERRIMDAAEIYVTRNAHLLQQDFELRFDLIYVTGTGMSTKVKHLKDAFRTY